jgi:hypothetical protein
VVWSFAMKALAVLVLRYKQPGPRGFRVPLNFHIAGVEIPVGLGLIATFLFVLAIVNLFTKETATIWGLGFSLVIFGVFELSEKYNRRKTLRVAPEIEKFRLDTPPEVSMASVNARPGNVLVTVHNPNQLDHVKQVLEKTNTDKIDVVVLTVKAVTEAGSGEHDLTADQLFTDDIAKLFSNIVSLAEKAGKHVELMVVPGFNPAWAIMETAQRLQSSVIVMGLSAKMAMDEQAKVYGNAWERLPEPRPQLSLQIIDPDSGTQRFFNLGPHPPRLWPEDVELLHGLWLELTECGPGHKLHHRDVVRVALQRLNGQLHSPQAEEVIREIMAESGRRSVRPPSLPPDGEPGGRTG